MDYYIHKDLGFLLDKFKDNNYRNFYDFKLYKNNIVKSTHLKLDWMPHYYHNNLNYNLQLYYNIPPTI